MFTFRVSFGEVFEVQVFLEEAMGQGTERQPVRPGGREVGYIHPRVVAGNTGTPREEGCPPCQVDHATAGAGACWTKLAARSWTKPINK